jgi:hypothetical protein
MIKMKTLQKTKIMWKINLIFIILLFAMLIIKIHPFLSQNMPIDTDILVVEGWIPKSSLAQAMDEFKNGSYRYLITTGGPINKRTSTTSCNNYAKNAAKILIAYGLDKNLLIVVPASYVKMNRTYSYALALKNWIKTSRYNIKDINVYTCSVHARKSYIIYKKVLKPDVNVGVLSANPTDYNPQLWFFSIEGIKWIIRDSVGYLYALLL